MQSSVVRLSGRFDSLPHLLEPHWEKTSQRAEQCLWYSLLIPVKVPFWWRIYLDESFLYCKMTSNPSRYQVAVRFLTDTLIL